MPDPLVTEITDAYAAFIARLRQSTDVVALVGDRIADAVQEDWVPGQAAIIVRKVGGSSNAEVRHQKPRYDVWCIGSSGRNATQVLRRVHAWLMPAPQDRATSFKIGQVVVYSVLQDGGQSTRDPDEKSPWYAVIQAYLLDVSEVPL